MIYRSAADYRRAARCYPNSALYHAQLGWTLRLAGQETQAREEAEIAHKLPGFFKSRVTGVAALGRSRQDDALIPWAIEPLTGGTINGVSTAGMWNTPAA